MPAISTIYPDVLSIRVCTSARAAATVASTLLLYGSIQDEKATLQRAAESKELSTDLGAASDHLTEEIQRYVSTGDRQHYDHFWREVRETKTRERVVERIINDAGGVMVECADGSRWRSRAARPRRRKQSAR